METETLNDVLNQTSEFHRELSKSLARCSDHAQGARAQMLLQYLADHEAELSRVVEGFQKQGSATALSTWCYDYNEQYPALQLRNRELPFAAMSTAQIMDAIMELHEQVIQLYRYLVARADIPESRDLLKDLESLEEHEAMRMAQSANRLEDI